MNISQKTKQVAFLGVFFALSIALSLFESAMPHIPFMPPGVKIGLSNIVVMYCLFFLRAPSAFLLVILKSLFVLIIRGLTAGFLSFSGGILSIVIMLLLKLIFKEKLSYMFISICGALFHNIGQFLAISLIFLNFSLVYYLPLLIISGILAGVLSATILKLILPAIHRIFNIKVSDKLL